jgi:hypothetical protein
MARIHPGQPLSGSQSGRARRRRLEAGRSCNRSLWSMPTDFRFGSQALQRSSGLRSGAMQSAAPQFGGSASARGILKPRSTGQHRGDSPISKMEAEPDKRAGTVSKTDRSTSWDGEHDLRLPPLHAGLAEQPCTRLVNEIRPGHSPAHRPPLSLPPPRL